jgi:alginate production protein
MKNPILQLVVAAALAAALPRAAEAQFTAGTKFRGAVYGEEARDLGLAEPDPEGEAAGERNASYVELNPYLHFRFGEDSAFYVRSQLFAAGGDPVIQNEDERPVAAEQYAALREAWLQFGGPTSFPGEVVRLGLQRIKEQDGLWWDRDVESLRWIFDTTLVQAQVGIAEQFGTWRSDDVELSPSQRDRAYVFATMTRQWQPGHFYGVRAAYAQDHGDLPQVGDSVDVDTKTRRREYLWVALRSENGYYDPRTSAGTTYWFEAILLAGRRESANQGPSDPFDPNSPPSGTVDSIDKDTVSALAGDMGLRFRLPLVFPMNLGFMASMAQGDRSGDQSHVFEQTGLESNRSRYTGTRTLIHRYNEALAGDWSNLVAANAFISMPYELADFSFVYHRFARHDPDETFTADGIDARPITDSRDLGTGLDFVVTRYFRGFSRAETDDDDARSNLRLRASRFTPGAAYGTNVEDQFRVTLELTLWL